MQRKKMGRQSRLRLRTEPGIVIDPASGRRMSYGEDRGIREKRPSPLPSIRKIGIEG